MSYNHKSKKKKIIDTKHKNPFSPMNIGASLNSNLEDKVILSNMGKKDIVFGSFAFNHQVKFPFPYKKTPKGDIDIKSKKPLFTALKIERALDKNVGMNNYFIEPLKHDAGTTYRVKSRARNTVVADIGKLDKPIKTVLIKGNLFETLGGRKKAVKSLLKSPDAQYRRSKDKTMMGYINRYENQILNRDTDNDGVPDSKDCEPFNPEKQGVIHDWLEKRKALKEAQVMSKLGYTPTEDVQDDINERLSESETGIQHFKTQIAEQGARMQENIKESFSGTDKNVQRMASAYTKRAESNLGPYQRTPQRERAINYMIPAPQKMYVDPDTGEPCSIPKFRREKYVPFRPHTTGKMFTPKQAPLPKYLLIRKIRRLLLYYQETKQYDKLRELQTQLRGGNR